MFFVMGISDKEVKLNFDQLVICKCCGKYGHVEVFMRYTYFMFFFIPLFKWNKRYYVRMNCCNSISEISSDIGKGIENGTITSINPYILRFEGKGYSAKRCNNCGFTTFEDFDYCPKCGSKL